MYYVNYCVCLHLRKFRVKFTQDYCFFRVLGMPAGKLIQIISAMKPLRSETAAQ